MFISKKQYTNLLDENKKLTDLNYSESENNKQLISWIFNILNEIGYESNEKLNQISIPVYRQVYNNSKCVYNLKNSMGQYYEEEIIIPTIKFVRKIYQNNIKEGEQ